MPKNTQISFKNKYDLARSLHEIYEDLSKLSGWETQTRSRVDFDFTPKENKRVMIELAQRILDKKESEVQELKESNKSYSDKWKLYDERFSNQELQIEKLQKENEELKDKLSM